MQRWDANTMQTIGSKLFDKIHKRKKHSHHNHEIHFMARDRNWLPAGIQSLVDGTYEPRCLKRYYFSDEMVDQLHISDRVFQHLLLRILKPTFKHVMNPNCYHLDGSTGVKNATQKIREVLQHSRPKYFIRADVKSFSPQDQTLSYSMAMLVGKFIRHLETLRAQSAVYRNMS